MSTAKSLVTTAAAILLAVSIVCAQEQTPASSRSVITVTATADRVRFTAPSTIVQIRLEVYNSAGRKLFDNEMRGANVLDWHLQDGQADPLEDDSYLCVVTAKSLSGKLTQRIGSVKVENSSVTVQAVDPSQVTAQQSQAIGPVEENSSLTVLKEDDTRTTTVIAHNGEEGQITRGRGALSFRIGDFYGGKDTEQMRLTAEGNLGIGITHPLVRLDVDGLFRASQGIVFPDGSIQYSAATRTFGAKSSLPDPSFQSLGSKPGKKPSGGQEHIEAISQNMVAKFQDGGGTLTNSSIFDNGTIGIGTISPDSLINIQGAIPSLLGHMAVIRTTGSNNGAGLLMDAIGSGNNNLALSVNGSLKGGFSWDNGRNFIGLVNFVYSPNDFSLRVNGDGSLTYHDGMTSAERFRITKDGNVGIGTNNPSAKLHVAGGEVLFENKWRTETTTVNPGPVAGPPNLIGGFLGTGSGGANPGNRVTAGVVGATIGGGGFNGFINFPSIGLTAGDVSNRVTDWFGTVGGGAVNRAGNDNATLDDAFFATVGGGSDNTASGRSATVGGGLSNTASEAGATVGGGGNNTASGPEATVPGGSSNVASGERSFAAGYRAKANHNGAFVWADSTGAEFVSTGNDQFLIRAAGGVGIGTAGPANQLSVAGTADFSGNVGIGTANPTTATGGRVLHIEGGSSALKLVATDANGKTWEWQSTVIGGVGSMNLSNISNGNNPLTIYDNGRVGIGTVGNLSPDQTLSVNGDASKSGGGSWLVYSDERLKNIKGGFTPGLQALMQLQPIRYEYKSDNALGIRSTGDHIGFGAQAVQKIIPEAVTKNDKGYLLVNNDPIMWTMVNAIKEQQEQIKEQQKEIETVRAANAALDSRLQALEKRSRRKVGL